MELAVHSLAQRGNIISRVQVMDSKLPSVKQTELEIQLRNYKTLGYKFSR